MNSQSLHGLDWGILIAYFVILLAIGIWASTKRKKGSSLFLAEHSLRWHHIGFSMWGTNVGPSMLIASASAGFTTGVVSGNYAWYAFVFIALLAFVFAPRYLGSKVSTLPEFMGLRFGGDPGAAERRTDSMEGRAMSEETIIRTAVVTGGSRGIGRAVCIQLAKQGCNVVVNYCHGEAAAAETVALCKAENADAVAVQADVSTAEGCKALFEQAVNAFGRVDILVNNAGITRDNLILRMSEADFDAVLDANLKGAFLCCKEAARRMVRQRWGRIVNLSSVVALRGNAGQTNYAASKAGLIGLTKSLARELASRNVTVNAVAPGFIETDMTAALPEAVRTEMAKDIPAGRAGQPEDVANAVAFFAAEQSSYLTGQVLCVDGGMAM